MNRYWVGKASEIRETAKKIVEVNGQEMGVFYVDGEYYAWRNFCPHGAAPVCQGTVCGTKLPSEVYRYEYGAEGQILRCPWHGWEFHLKTGKHLAESNAKLRGYPVQLEEDDLYVLMD